LDRKPADDSAGLHESLSGVIAITFRVPDIFRDHLDRCVAAVLAHLEQVGVLSPCFGEEAGAQRVAGERLGWIAGVTSRFVRQTTIWRT
jgi:hypothetical protein